MILTKFVTIRKHSSNIAIMSKIGVQQIDGMYTLPCTIFMEYFPKSNIVYIEYKCNKCCNIHSISVADYNSKIHKDYCGVCLKSKILVGSKAAAFGNRYHNGKSKSQTHIENMKKRPKRYGVNNPNWKEDTPEFKRYKGRVHQLTAKVYNTHHDVINPNNYPRTVCGVQGGWQLDHIVSIRECFNRGYTIEEAACLDNLQMLPWKHNLLKSCSISRNT